MRRVLATGTLVLLTLSLVSANLDAAELYIGAAKTSITPDQPVGLSGQIHARVAREVETPCTASVLVIEAREGDRKVDELILVSGDLVSFRPNVQERFREYLKERGTEFDPDKVVLAATHSHTAPVMVDGRYALPDDCMKPSDYVEFLVERLAGAIDEAWKSRKRGGVSWGLGHAVVAQNRRMSYFDGSTRMYGKTNQADFSHVEGFEDHGVHVLFAHDREQPAVPMAVAVDVACPAQEVESGSKVNADFWHYVREALSRRFSPETAVLGLCAAAGDQSPHLMWRKGAEERMREARGLNRLQEIARRIDRAVEDAWAVAKEDVRYDVPMRHSVLNLNLSMRQVTEAEYEEAKKAFAELSAEGSKGLNVYWAEGIVRRYEAQKEGAVTRPAVIHVVRLGDIAICTNPFELFTDFGVRIQARSPAIQTFVIQLAGRDGGGYLPTERAVQGGGYGAEIKSTPVGPAGGQELVEATLAELNRLWEAKSE